ncbi:MAG: hypothetical protein IPJ69_01710 [Deltaproteobacteria bacterium]|nr:MAG: hypothetical protein IPJ69_01710 [Deltaproteobacteria bacterium]
MRNKISNMICSAMGASLVLIAGCGGANSGLGVSTNLIPESSLNNTSVSNSVTSGMDAVALSLQPDNSGVISSTSTIAALRSGVDIEHGIEQEVESEVEHGTEAESVEIERHRRVMQGSRVCSDSDQSLQKTITCDDTSHTAVISRDYRDCSSENEHGIGVSVTGNTATVWSHMGDVSCPAVNQKPTFWQAVQGQGSDTLATQVFTTDPEHPTAPQVGVTRQNGRGTSVVVKGYALNTYSAASVTALEKSVHQQVTIPGFSRIRYKNDGVTKLFDHTVATETPLEIDLVKSGESQPTRTIVSGTLAVSHNLASFTTHTTFTNVKYDYNECECHPVSGSVAISVTDNTSHSEIGSGTVTFNSCASATIHYEGREIALPELDSCR